MGWRTDYHLIITDAIDATSVSTVVANGGNRGSSQVFEKGFVRQSLLTNAQFEFP